MRGLPAQGTGTKCWTEAPGPGSRGPTHRREPCLGGRNAQTETQREQCYRRRDLLSPLGLILTPWGPGSEGGSLSGGGGLRGQVGWGAMLNSRLPRGSEISMAVHQGGIQPSVRPAVVFVFFNWPNPHRKKKSLGDSGGQWLRLTLPMQAQVDLVRSWIPHARWWPKARSLCFGQC